MDRKGNRSVFSALTLLLGLFGAVLAYESNLAAQLTTATISGTVKDQSGAVLPGATVTASNTETGISRKTTAGSQIGRAHV